MTQSNSVFVPEFDKIVGNKDPIEVVKVYARAVADHYYDVGMMLYVIKENDLYHNVERGKYISENHKLWRAFVEDHISDIGYRTAQYWINTWHYFWSMNKTKADLQGIGWAKAKELINVTEDEEVLNELLEFAKDNTIDALKNEIQKHLPPAKKKDPVFKLSIKTSEAVGVSIQDSIEFAKKVFDQTEDDKALIELIIEWRQLKAASMATDMSDAIQYHQPEPDFID